MRTLFRGKYAWATGLVTAGLIIYGMQQASAVDTPTMPDGGVELFPCLPIYSISTGEQLSDCAGGTHPIATWTTCTDGRVLARVVDGDTVHWGYGDESMHDGEQGYASALDACDRG